MRNSVLAATLFGLTVVLLGGMYNARPIEAQAITAATPFSFAVTGTLANCPAASATISQYCFTNTGLYQSLDATTWTLIGTAAAPQLTINGVQKSLPASFTIATSSTATVPAASFASNGALTLSAPSVTSTTTAQ